MDRVIHICFSASAGGSLKHAIKSEVIKGDKVICLYDDLSNGPIDKLNTIDKRLKWLKKIILYEELQNTILSKEPENSQLYKEIYNELEVWGVREFKEKYDEYHKEIINVDNEDTIYFWCAENAMELTGLMYTLELLNCSLDKTYLINASEVTYNQGMINEFTPRAIGEIAPKRFPEFMKISKKINEEMYQSLSENFKVLKSKNTNLRVYKDGKVISVSEDYFDEFILHYVEEKFRKSARAVGNVLGHNKDLTTDTYIVWRITELIKNNKIQYKGKFGIMRYMEIKK